MMENNLDIDVFNVLSNGINFALLGGLGVLGLSLNLMRGERLRARASLVLGALMTGAVLGADAPPYLAALLLAALVVRLAGPRYCHWACFAVMFTYVSACRIVFMTRKRDVTIVANLMLMNGLLKMVGVAFEIHSSHHPRGRISRATPSQAKEEPLDLSVMDMLCYVLSHIGIVIGPYIRYSVYKDFLTAPFSKAVDKTILLKENLVMLLPVISALCWVFTDIFVLEDIAKAGFMDRGFLYLSAFGMAQWLKFRLGMYVSFGLQLLLCGILGQGAYPAEGRNISSHGPTADISHLKKLSLEDAKKLKYDFKTLRSVDIYKVETGLHIAEGLKQWNKASQYWLAVHIHQGLSKDWFTKNQRLAITFIVSGLWHGIHPGIFLCMILHILYIIVERMLLEIKEEYIGWKSTTIDTVLGVARQYLCPIWVLPLIVHDTSIIFAYFKATYFAPFIVQFIMYAVAHVMLEKSRTRNNNNSVYVKNQEAAA